MAVSIFELGWGNQPRVLLHPGGVFLPVGQPLVSGVDVASVGDGLYRMAWIIDDQTGNPLNEARVTQTRVAEVVQSLSELLARVPAVGELPPGIDPLQAAQVRASAGVVLLSLVESQKGKTSDKAKRIVSSAMGQYFTLISQETSTLLAEKLCINLDWILPCLPKPLAEQARGLMDKYVPSTPPYAAWFRDGSVLRIDWKCGSEFLDGWRRRLGQAGFQVASDGGSWGSSVLKKVYKVKDVVTEVEFELGPERSDVFRKMNDPSVHIVGYDGHSDWGRKIPACLNHAPEQVGDKAIFYLLCCGKQILQKVRDTYPRAQVVTTFNSAKFTQDFAYSEDFTAVMHMLEGISRRESWNQIRDRINKDWYNNPEKNYIFPNEVLAMARSLDKDHDGQADVFDRLVDFNTFDVPNDTAREFRPIVPQTPPHKIVGTKLHLGVQVFHTLCHFNQVMEHFTRDLRVFAAGWYDPGLPAAPGTREFGPTRVVIKKGEKGPEYYISASFHYAHTSGEAWRALLGLSLGVVVASNESDTRGMAPLDRVLNTLVMVAQGLEVDDAPFGRDQAIWDGLLTTMGISAPVPLMEVQSAKKVDPHQYAGSRASIQQLKTRLPPATLEALTRCA